MNIIAAPTRPAIVSAANLLEAGTSLGAGRHASKPPSAKTHPPPRAPHETPGTPAPPPTPPTPRKRPQKPPRAPPPATTRNPTIMAPPPATPVSTGGGGVLPLGG